MIPSFILKPHLENLLIHCGFLMEKDKILDFIFIFISLFIIFSNDIEKSISELFSLSYLKFILYLYKYLKFNVH